MPAPARRFYYATRRGQVFFKVLPILFSLVLVLLSGCAALSSRHPAAFEVTIRVDHREFTTSVLPGETVQRAIARANIKLGPLDWVEPPPDAVLTSDHEIRIVRVREEVEIEQKPIPYEHQQVRSGALPEGETRILQPGKDGRVKITDRVTYEDDLERSRVQVHTETLAEPVPEILLVGIKAPYAQLQIPGKIVYLSNGNAYLMDGSTSSRKPILATGDLDGRIFSLSPEGGWLLVTRKLSSTGGSQINSLWAVSLAAGSAPIDLKASNVVHFASWIPGETLSAAYSTVEPREEAPGWQANNDLMKVSISPSGEVSDAEVLLETNSGGIYGWWGMRFSWSPDGSHLAYARPDSVGLVNLEEKKLVPLYQMEPVHTETNWVWSPEMSWNPDGKVLYASAHPANEAAGGSLSPYTLIGIDVNSGSVTSVADDTGQFSFPSVSTSNPDRDFQIAFFDAKAGGENSAPAYDLMVSSPDGSQVAAITPEIDGAQIEPQMLFWSPQAVKDVGESIAGIIQGNLWIIPVDGSRPLQITGDGSITRLDWK